MKAGHTPQVNLRYWTAITLASVFGTNMGDLYAHGSGLGMVKGLALLAFLTAILFVIERFDAGPRELYYWLVILVIRTGATNIADTLAYRARVPEVGLTLGLIGLLALFGWRTRRRSAVEERTADDLPRADALPRTDAAYWLAMLVCGVLGTVVGDICEGVVGEGAAAAGLAVLLAGLLLAGRGRAAHVLALYWATIAFARTTGTAVGDWLAETKALHIGLPLSTLLSGVLFAAVVILWPAGFQDHGSAASTGTAQEIA